MKISLKRVNIFSEDMKRIKQLYNTAFPDDERAPLILLALRSEKSGADFWSLYADGEWFGLAYAITEDDLTYLFYLAVSEEKRGQGLGSKALQTLKMKYYGNRFFLALEKIDENAENYSERLKRRQFYINNGLEPLGSTIKEGKVRYDVMGVGGNVRPEEYVRMMRNYLGKRLSKMVSMDDDNVPRGTF